jgi:hypothetical protein
MTPEPPAEAELLVEWHLDRAAELLEKEPARYELMERVYQRILLAQRHIALAQIAAMRSGPTGE